MQNGFRDDYATNAFTEFCRLIAHWDAEVIHQEVTDSQENLHMQTKSILVVKEVWKDIKAAIVLVITNNPKALSREL